MIRNTEYLNSRRTDDVYIISIVIVFLNLHHTWHVKFCISFEVRGLGILTLTDNGVYWWVYGRMPKRRYSYPWRIAREKLMIRDSIYLTLYDNVQVSIIRIYYCKINGL